MSKATWLFCCGMYRSGSTVQYQIASEIVERLNIGKRVGSVRPQNFAEIYNKHKHSSGILVVKSHECFTEAVELLTKGEAKALYSYRDLHDVVVSWIHKSKTSFDAILQNGFVESCLDTYYQWTAIPNILVSRYEDFVDNLEEETGRIANYLGVNLDPDTVRTIANQFTLEKQKKYISKFDYDKKGLFKSSKPGIAFDPHTRLHNNHIRAGAVGDWENELTPSEISAVEEKSFYWLIGRAYPVKYFSKEFQFSPSSPEIKLFEQIASAAALRILPLISQNAKLRYLESRESRLHWKIAGKIDQLWRWLIPLDSRRLEAYLNFRNAVQKKSPQSRG